MQKSSPGSISSGSSYSDSLLEWTTDLYHHSSPVMAAAVSDIQQKKVDDAEAKERLEFIPEIISERRTDPEGQLVVTKYIRGKLLGKVWNCLKSGEWSSRVIYATS